MKNSLIITLFFIAGILAGRIFHFKDPGSVNKYMEWSLFALMLFVGLSFGSDRKLKDIIATMNRSLFLLPLLTIAGTFSGVMIYTFLFDSISPKDAMAIGAGFGYYSLSSILIKEFSGSDIAVIALLSNVLREIITLLTAPLQAKYFGSASPICSAGATSMDTTLPVIVKASGKKYLIASLFHGILLTLLVPFIITIIYKVF